MSKITVKKVKPSDLTQNQIVCLNYLYKTELGKFVLFYDHKKSELLVNKSVPEDDIQRFHAIILYDNDYLNDDKLGCSDANYIYEKYGFPVYSILTEAWRKNRYDYHMKQAKEIAPGLVEVINTFRMDDNAPEVFDEFLVYQVLMAAGKKKTKTGKNIVGFGTECIFYLGYLMGKGEIKL